MAKSVHYVPVGFDFERLVQPFSEDQFNPDRVVLVHSTTKSEQDREAKLAEYFVEKVRNACESVLNYEVETRTIEDLYDYISLFQKGHEWFLEEIENGNEVFVNISSMPRTVAFAFATAVNTLIVNEAEMRGSIHTYYVSPEKYMMMDAWDELEAQQEFLESLQDEEISSDIDNEVDNRLEQLSETLSCLDNGVTNGVRRLSNGRYHTEFVAPPTTDLNETQTEMIRVLDYLGGECESIASLSDKHSSLKGKNPADGHQATVQYNIDELENKGFIERDKRGKQHSLCLSKTGEMWAAISKAYSDEDFENSGSL